MRSIRVLALVALLPAAASGAGIHGHLDTAHLPAHLRDRGAGVPLSMFATYVQEGQLIVYPFFEYYRDADFEYKPAELGYAQDVDYRGRYRATEELLFLAYGFTSRFAVEMEAAVIQAELEPADGDDSGIPRRLEESGIGDVEGQLRYRWRPETAGSAEVFSYFETVFPTQDEGSLIGTSGFELKLGTGVTRGLSWGTVTVRAAVEYDASESKVDVGEAAVEWVRRLGPHWRAYAGVEGTQDEVGLVTEAQWHLGDAVFLKLNNSLGITSKATDWAPEVGVVFTVPGRR